jgi:hypothetical protein
MAKQTFTTGQVLTAAQMTSLQANDYNWTVSAQTGSYVLTATNAGQHVTMNAAGATTITVNTALFTAGDTLRITNIGAGTCTITAGTATVTSAGALALTQWASGILYFTSASASIFFPDAKTSGSGSGLVYITGGSFTTVAAVSLTAGTFSSTYRNYLININITANSSDSNALNWRGRVTGTDNSTANYSFALGGRRYSDGVATSGGNGASATAGRLTFMQSPMTGSVVSATFFAPQLASPTSFVTSSTGRGVGDPDAALQGGGYFNASTQFDALSFYPATGTISGTYEVYGYAIS